MNKMREIMKKGMAMLLVMVMLIVAAPVVKTEAAVAVKLNKTKTVMYLASTQTIRISGTSIKRIATGNSKIATVRKTGSKTMEVRARKAGSTVVGIRGTNGKLYTCKVTVLSKKAPRISVARQVALYKARLQNKYFSNDGRYSYQMIDVNGDGVYEFVMDDSDGFMVWTINKKNQVVRAEALECLSINSENFFWTSGKKIISQGGSGMMVGRKPPMRVITYNSRTGEFEVAHELRYEVKSNEAVLLHESEPNYFMNSDVMNYYVDNVKYPTYRKAVTKFRSSYKGEKLRRFDICSASYHTIDEAYRHRVQYKGF